MTGYEIDRRAEQTADGIREAERHVYDRGYDAGYRVGESVGWGRRYANRTIERIDWFLAGVATGLAGAIAMLALVTHA